MKVTLEYDGKKYSQVYVDSAETELIVDAFRSSLYSVRMALEVPRLVQESGD